MLTLRRFQIVLLTLFTVVSLYLIATPFTGNPLQDATAQVRARGSFGYDAHIQTIVTPGTTIDKAGHSPQQHDLALRGRVDLRAETLDLELMGGSGSFTSQVGVVTVQVANGVARSRGSDGSWQTIDLPTGAFDPSSDVLSLLAAARDVSAAESEQVGGEALTRYRFQIDGPTFAQQVHDQMEQLLRRQGKLAMGGRLALIDAYLSTTGHGELLIDADGLPRRQVIQLSIPDSARGETVQGTITVDYHTFGPAPVLNRSLRWLVMVPWGSLSLNLGMVMAVGAAALCLVVWSRSRRLYRTLAVLLALIIVASPLLQSQPATAASSARSAPLPAAKVAPTRAAAPATIALNVARQLAVGTDTDKDGLSDSAEAIVGTDPTKADTDDDGLNDGVEVLEVGTNPTQRDTDGDGLSDGLELEPIPGPDGRIWRLNPFQADTNGDGQSDFFECVGNTFCPDLDGDKVPDAWDDDNDNDGVPDRIDAAPQAVVSGPRNADGSLDGVPNGRLSLAASNVTPGKTLLFDFTIRPTNPGRLWYSQSALDWPADDREGQIRRVLTDTLSTSGRFADGDMRVVPSLEIKIPYVANTFGGLPVKAGYTAADMPALDAGKLNDADYISKWFDQWLDRDKLTSYQISVRLNGPDRSLLAYVPLDLQRDPIGDAPVAFTARMLFRPQSGAVPNQDVRMAWNVQAKTDTCSAVPDADNAAGETFNKSWWNALPNKQRAAEKYTRWEKLSSGDRNQRWCSGTQHWTSNSASIIHTYYDDFYLTALDAQEDRGLEIATIAQNPDAGTAAFQPHLWNLARGLERAFVGGRDCDATTSAACNGNGQLDLTPSAIKARWDHANNGGVGQAERWNIPADALSVRTASFADEGDSAAMFVSTNQNGTQQAPLLLSFLNDTFVTNDQARTALPTVMLARLHTTATLGLQGGSTITDGMISFDMAEASAITSASLSWKPFHYKGAGIWEQVDLAQAWPQIVPALAAPLQRAGSSSAANTSATRGAEDMLFTFYLALNAGRGGMVAADGIITDRTSAADADEQLAASTQADAVASTIADSMAGALLQAQAHRTLLVNVDRTGLLTALGNQRLSGDGGPAMSLLLDVGRLPSGGNDGLYSKAFAALGESLATSEPEAVPASRTLDAMRVAADRVDKVNAVYGAFDALKAGYETGQLVKASLAVRSSAETISKAMDAISTVDKLGDAQGKLSGLVTSLQNVTQKINKAAEAVTDASKFSPDALGIVVEVVVFAGKLMALISSGDITFFTITSLIAETAASVTVNVFMLGALAAIVPVGTIIAALIGLIDAAIGIACGFSPSIKEKLDSISEMLCDGIGGNLTKFVTAIFWDTQPLVDMTADNRLTPTNWNMQPRPDLLGGTIGMVAGNTLDVSADVVTKLNLNTKTNFSTLQILQSADKLPNATFRYQFTTKEEKDDQKINERLHLAQQQMRSSWKKQPNGTAYSSQVVTQTVTTTLTLDKPQLNWHPDGFYLAEGYAVPSLYCVLRLCGTYTKSDSNYLNLAPSFAFDVFPKTIDGFMSLTDSDSKGGFRTAWDASFPTLKDADGDGLYSRAEGGTDPADNAPDSDRDGLSDTYELAHASLGLNPLRADSDNDGLSDLEEMRLDLDPSVADMDNDGLTDGEEIKGWDIVYGYAADDTPLRFRVTSDPRDADTDHDGLLDKREQVYGFNPRVVSDSDPLQIQSHLQESDGVNDGIVSAGSSIGFSAVLSSTLRDRFALGLFEADLESTAPKPDVSPTAYRLGPLANTTLSGTLSLSGQTSTTTTNILTRAGAVIAGVQQLSGGRVLWLPFEEQNSSAGYADSSPFGNNASCAGSACPTVTNAGYNGRALSFATGNLVTVANSPTLASTTFTLSLWVNPNGMSSNTRPIIQRVADANGEGMFSLAIAGGGNNVLVDAGDADCRSRVISGGSNRPLSMNSWNLLTLVSTGTQLSFYINGSPSGTWTASGGLCAANTPLRIVGPTGGMLDDVALYPYPMTPTQVQDQFRDPVLQMAFNGNIDDSSNLRQKVTIEGNRAIRNPNSRDGDRVGVFDKRSWLDIASSPSLDMAQGTGQFTLAAYVRPVPLNPDQDWQAIMGKQEGFDTYPSLYVNRNGQLRVEFGTGSALCDSGATTGKIAGGTWSHVAVSYTGSQFVFYINGVETERLALSGACSSGSRPTGSSLFIGRSSPNATLNIKKIVVEDEGDGIGTAEYEARWNQNHVWGNDDVDIGTYEPDELKKLSLDSDNSFRFELKEIDTCGSCDDIEIDTQLRNYQVNADGVWSYDDDGEGKVYWQLWNNWFNGDLDEVQVYRVALDAAGARNLYNSLNNRAYALQTRLEEPPTTTIFRDGSGNLQTGFCSGTSCPTTGLPGRDGQAAAFDGNDAIVIANRPTLDLTAGLTAAAWVKLDDVNADQKILSKYDPNAGGYTLGVVNGKIYGELKDSTGVRTEVLGGAISPGVWTHLAMSASPGQYLVGYINGVEVQRAPLAQTQGDVVAVGRPIAREVTLFDDQGYEANSAGGMVWTTNHDESSFDPSGFGDDNNEASSIKTNGACVRLYDDEDYGGDSQPVCDNTSLLASFNDRAESMRHYTTPPSYSTSAGGLKFDRGRLQYLQIDPARVGNPTFSTFSATAWVNVSFSDEWHTIVARGARDSSDGFNLRIDKVGHLVYQAGGSTFTSTGTITNSTWTHVAVTHDGTVVRFYINGVEAGTNAFIGSINDVNSPIFVGRLGQCGTASFCDFFNGTIHDLGVYTRALSANEVVQLRDTPSGASPNGRVFYLPLNADQGRDGDNAPTFRTLQARSFATNDQNLTIGRTSAENAFFVHGMIDEATLLEYATDGTEVAKIMNEAPIVRLALDDVLGSTSFANVAGAAATCGGSTSTCPQAGARGRIREAPVFGASENTGLLLPSATAPLSNFSVELWVRPEAVRPGEQILVAKADNDGSNANLVLSLAPGTLTPRLRVNNTQLTAQRALNQGQWNHIVATYNGALQLYINGTSDGSVANNALSASAAPIRVGYHPGLGVGFNGMLDELSIYAQALSAETVNAHYQYQESWFDVVERHELTVDGDAPTASFGLENNLVVAKQPLSMSVAASDPTSHVQSVFYDADGDATEGPWLAAQPSDDGTNWMFTYTPTSGGSFPLRAYAEDIFGHRSATISTMIRVDDLAPTVTLTPSLAAGTLRPVPGTGDDQGTWLLNLAGTVSDNQSGTPTVVAEVQETEGTLGSVTADVAGGAWSGVFRFSAPPNGRYTVKIHATDAVGNRQDAEPIVLTLDATAPLADVTIGSTQIGNPAAAQTQSASATAPMSVMSSMLQSTSSTSLAATTATTVVPPVLRGTLSDMPGVADTVLMVHAEEPNGATSFLDSSVFQQVGTCAGAGCPSVVAGRSGQGLHFDGIDDQINFATLVARPADSAYSVSVWAWPTADDRTLVSAADANGPSLELRAVAGGYTVMARVDGTMVVVGSGTLTPNTWNHLAVSFDGTSFATYSGGALVQSMPVSGTVAGFNNVWIGSYVGAGSFYQGDADELSIYSVPLSAERVAWLADAVRSPSTGAAPRLLHVKDQGDPSAAITLTATLTPTNDATLWSAAVPQQLEGIYQLDMGTRDNLDNKRELPGIWRGVIDTRAPAASMFMYRMSDGRALVRCQVSDFDLDPSQIDCPVPTSQWHYTNLSESWYTALFPDAPRRVQMSTSTVVVSGVVRDRMRACDSFGNCTEAVATASGATGGLSVFTTPTPGQIITAPGPISLSGIALAEAGLRSLQITSGNTDVLSKTFTSETLDEWTTTVNLDDGIYQLQATAIGSNGQVYTDTLAPRVMVDRTPPMLYLPMAGSSGAPHLSAGKLAFTLNVMETVALGKVEAQLHNGSWQTLDTSALIDNRGAIQAALDLSDLGMLDGQQLDLTLRATDQAGHVTTITRQLTLDTTAPRVTVNQVTLANSTGFVASGEVQEGGGTPTLRLIVDIDGTQREYPIQLVAGAAGRWSWQVALPYDPSFATARFSVVAIDPAGNQAQRLLQGAAVTYYGFLPLVTR